jgi:SAM-dependent methyltransferase
MTRSFEWIPDLGEMGGSGHLRRALELQSALGGTLLLPEGPTEQEVRQRAGADQLPSFKRYPKNEGEDGKEDTYTAPIRVFDCRTLSLDLLERLGKGALTVGLDLGGPGRAAVDYLIDTIPRTEAHPANVSDPGLLKLPDRVRRNPPDFRRPLSCLVSFGGQDPLSLSTKVCNRIVRDAPTAFSSLSVTVPPARGEIEVPESIRKLEIARGLRERLADYEAVITAFGLTAFEALYAGCLVLLVHPSPYHRRLGQESGLPDIGFQGISARKLKQVLANAESMWHSERRRLSLEPRSLSSLLAELSPDPDLTLWPNADRKIYLRLPGRTVFREPKTGLFTVRRFRGERPSYGSSYFFEEYRAQYGKSYLEDFDHIKAVGHRRMKIIQALGAGGGLLDLGCAYGPFLSAAAHAGFQPHGVELNADAASFVKEKLGFAVIEDDLVAADLTALGSPRSFGAVTMWYVIEHIHDLDSLLRKVNTFLRPGGVFAFSTPHARGISALRNRRDFFERNPSDHVSVWTAASARAVLRRYGFRLRKIRVTGHHPERFPGNPAPESLLGRLLLRVSKLFRLGDTFEAYAVKIGGPA